MGTPIFGTPDRPVATPAAPAAPAQKTQPEGKKRRSDARKQLTGRALERQETIKHLAATYKLMLMPGKLPLIHTKLKSTSVFWVKVK